MQFFRVSSQHKHQIFDHANRNRFGSKFAALRVHRSGGKDVLSGSIKGKPPALVSQFQRNRFAVSVHAPANGGRFAAFDGQADFCGFALMKPFHTGGQCGFQYRQDDDFLCGGVLCSGGIRKFGRQDVFADF